MKATTWFYSQGFNRASDPTNPPDDPRCDRCGGGDLDSLGQCADCDFDECGRCLIAREPAEPDYDAVSFAERHDSAYAAKRAAR